MKALICGVSGQDGAFLAELLLKKGYEVVGTSRDSTIATFENLKSLGIRGDINTVSMAINDFRSVFNVVHSHRPDEIYNLAGQTSVGLSFEQPVEAMESIASATLNMLEVIRLIDRPVRFYNAGSSECFGDTGSIPATELTPFEPRSPYAVAKASSYWLTRSYRSSYEIFACTGLLFNHESVFRPERFVTQKIVRAAARIKRNSTEKLLLGNIDIERDWGWAPEYADAMWRMLQQPAADDFVIATGKTVSLRYFVERVFHYFGLNWTNHVQLRQDLHRPSDINFSCANPAKAERVLGWTATTDIDGVIYRMCEAANALLKD